MKKSLLAMLLAFGASVACAAPVTVNFTYQGFAYATNIGGGSEEPEWQSWVTYNASFTGEDTDGDQVIGWLELSALTVAGVDYFAPQQPGRSHWIDRFEYRGVSDYLIETTVFRYNDDLSITDEKRIGLTPSSQYDHWSGQDGYERWYSTSATIATVTQVPEPATVLMLGAGLALTGAAVRRRRAR